MSIVKSFTQKELQKWSPKNWQVTTLFPFRLLAIYHEKPTEKESLDSRAREVSV
jgi:hypothetical protein